MTTSIDMRPSWTLCALLVAGCTSSPTGIGGPNGNVAGGNDMAVNANGGGGGSGGTGGGGGGVGGGGGGGSGGGGGTCAHDTCTAGVALVASCDPCVAEVCSSDAYCCSNKWNSRCVTEAAAACATCSGGGGG